MTDTQHKTKAPIGLNQRTSTASAQWLLESPADKNTPVHQHNALKVTICGQEGFKDIVADIKNAKSSVEIICWGFDPAMELIRTAKPWPRGETWGGLLKDVAQGKYNAGKPVQVRVLAWYNPLLEKFTKSLPGYGKAADYDLQQAASRGMAGAVTPGGAKNLPPPPEPTNLKDKREVFNARWHKDVLDGKPKQLAFRTRDADAAAIATSLAEEPGQRDASENLSFTKAATHHQKTILIDYEHEGGANAVGYVMGLNSVTDYWDTPQHLFNDPLRGAPWEGTADGDHIDLKPLQDYACRIQGEALVAVSKNFTEAWNLAPGRGEPLARTHDVQAPPAGLTQNIKGTAQRAQIVRTQPQESDKSIKRLYEQATSFARQYIFIENQYFQYAEWAQHLKTCRQNLVKGWEAPGKSPGDLPNLHVMVVIPTPERPQMVPRTYDTVKALGHGNSMPDQDKRTEEELKRHAAASAAWEAHVRSARAKGQVPDPDFYPGDLSTSAQSAKAMGAEQDIAEELKTLGMRTLVGSLWTFNHEWRTTQKDELRRAEEWKGVAGAEQRHAAMEKTAFKKRYREIYIHSKLMLIDDAMFTLGSANLNLRSMAVDAEINVASDDRKCSEDLRKRVWKLHTDNAEGCNPASLAPALMKDAFEKWEKLMKSNRVARVKGDPPQGFLFPFKDERTSRLRLA